MYLYLHFKCFFFFSPQPYILLILIALFGDLKLNYVHMSVRS